MNNYVHSDGTDNDIISLEPEIESLEISDIGCNKDTCCVNDVRSKSDTCCTNNKDTCCVNDVKPRTDTCCTIV